MGDSTKDLDNPIPFIFVDVPYTPYDININELTCVRNDFNIEPIYLNESYILYLLDLG